jgi:hypothetical protein
MLCSYNNMHATWCRLDVKIFFFAPFLLLYMLIVHVNVMDIPLLSF